MRSIPILILCLVMLSLSCNKDKFTTKPQLKFKSANTTVVSGNTTLEIRLDLTDKEGDYTPLLGIKKSVLGCPGSEFIDSTKFSIPTDFIDTKQTEGEVVVSLDKLNRGSNTCTLPGGATRPDTTVFSFWTRDRAGNVSDTARTQQIIILD